MAACTATVTTKLFQGVGKATLIHITGAAAATAVNSGSVYLINPSGIEFAEITADDDGGDCTLEYSSDDGVLVPFAALSPTQQLTAAGVKGLPAASCLTGYYRIAYANPAGGAAKDITILLTALCDLA